MIVMMMCCACEYEMLCLTYVCDDIKMHEIQFCTKVGIVVICLHLVFQLIAC